MTKKIIQISPFSFDHMGGVEKYAEILNQELSSENIHTLAGGKDFSIFEPVKNCPVPKFWQKNFWKVIRQISRENTKIILSHIRFAPTTWMAFLLAKHQKIPYIHIEHGTGFLVHKNFLVRNIAKLLDITIGKYILKNADFVICISKASENWVKNFTKRNNNITTIYRGFEMIPTERILQSQNTIQIGFVGRLVSLKNVDILIKSLKNLKNFSWECKIVGDGEMRGEYENLVKKYHLEEKIKFLGSKKHSWILQNFYPNIDIFVNPSLQEGLPTTVIEAKIAGCEVLATNVGGTTEIPDIHLCEPTEFSITKNIEKLLIQSTKISQKSPLSEEFIQKFSLQTMKENFIKIFNTL